MKQGFTEMAYACTWAKTIAEGEDALANAPHDLVVLDLGLPDGNGLDLLRRWRACGFNEPVIILSARGDTQERVQGLNAGADDYLAKPFSFEELLARVRSQLRRKGTERSPQLAHQGIVMDLEAHAVTLDGKPVVLTNREYAILEILLRNRGRTVTRTQLAERVWDAHHDMETNLIDVYIRRLRQKLETPGNPPPIATHRGVGYSIG